MQSLMRWIYLTIYIEAFMMHDHDILQLKRQIRLKQVQMRGICACMQNGLECIFKDAEDNAETFKTPSTLTSLPVIFSERLPSEFDTGKLMNPF